MNTTKNRILAVDLRRSRFGYAVLDGPNLLLEWGSGEILADGKDRGAFKSTRLHSVLRVASPAAVIVRRSQQKGNLDTRLRDRLYRQIKRVAEAYSIPSADISQEQIKRAFHVAPRVSKHQIASVIARIFPELQLKLPVARRAWEPERHSMIVFDSIAAGLAYLQPDGVGEPPE
jgi:hypothetical protein